MEVDLKGYLKFTENVKTPDKPLSEHGSTQGAEGGVIQNNATAQHCTIL